MSPHDAALLLTELRQLFEITSANCDLVRKMMEGATYLSYATGREVIFRFAQETGTFDRGRLITLLREENSRRAQRPSPTVEWRAAKEAETEARERTLNALPVNEQQKLAENVQQQHPVACRMLRSNLLQTDIGRSLIYDELERRRIGEASLARPT
jgi:hypothetical protein